MVEAIRRLRLGNKHLVIYQDGHLKIFFKDKFIKFTSQQVEDLRKFVQNHWR